jgi:AGZA family xanthine/uracil permease-like MFS transporter
MPNSSTRYPWFVSADLNGFFGVMFDNLTVLSFLAGILIFGFGFPSDVIFIHMFPGTAIGVLAGDLVYTYMAFALAKRSGKKDVTAIPLGLDTPSTIGLALIVLGPTYQRLAGTGMASHEAAMQTWRIGMAIMILMGVAKLLLSYLGKWIQKIIPRAGLLGSLAGIGLALIGLIPLVDIFRMPLVGVISLGLVLYSLVAGLRLPWNLPGILVAVAVGTITYYVFAPMGLIGGTYTHLPLPRLYFELPIPTLQFVPGLRAATTFLPLVIPFALLTVMGGINVTESARLAGDDYDTRSILLIEAFTTLLAGLCGGVAQTTPYIGHSAYKAIGCRAGYTLLTGLFVGLAGIMGFAPFIVELIPSAVLAPILIFVAIDIMTQSFHEVPRIEGAAVVFALFPSIARLLTIKLTDPSILPPEALHRLLSVVERPLPELGIIIALGNGFVLTGMLWGAFVSTLIQRRIRASALFLLILAALSLCGIVHSALLDGRMYWPWTLDPLDRRIPYQFALAYGTLAAMFLLLSFVQNPAQPALQ